MPLPLYIVDAFTDRPFAGNPAGVCVLNGEGNNKHHGWPAEAWMQSVAAELKHAETAFILPTSPEESNPAEASASDGPRDARHYPIRYFSPAVEVALCGHATLAAAHALWQHGHAPPGTPLVFRTHEGQALTCRRTDDGAIAMDFPADPPRDADAPAGLLDALGLSPSDVTHVARGRFDVLVELKNLETLLNIAPDFRALAAIKTRGIATTAPGNISANFTNISSGRASSDDERNSGGADFTSRFFAPAAGIDEDPATGSAHCLLGPYWATRLGKNQLLAYQASARSGTVGVTVHAERVELRGQAVTVTQGHWLQPDSAASLHD